MSNYSLNRFIQSTLKLSAYVSHYRLMSRLPKYLEQVAIGLLLSDGSIERPTQTGGARMSVMLGFDTLPYLFHLYVLFEPYIEKGPSFSDVNNKKTGKVYQTVRIRTGMMPIFVYYHNMFYRYNEEMKRYVKIIPYNIYDLMTRVVLAQMIKGDGNLQNGANIIRIYTNSFTKLEVENLASIITSKLGIDTKAVHDRNGQYMLKISKSQLDKVRKLVGPYMYPSMQYKLGVKVDSTVGFNYKNIMDQI